MKGFWLGCNYWDSEHGTDMWKYFDEKVIREDMECMKKYNVHYLRVFPNWRDFQPVNKSYMWRGQFREYVVGPEERALRPGESGIDPQQIENFHTFARIAEENGIELCVGVVTGWMSGRLYVPPVLEGKNLINDPEALMWTEKYVRGLVAGIKDCPNIRMWDLGNECNCLGEAKSRAEAYVWTYTVRNAILAEDNTRPISSGMHSLGADPCNDFWLLQDQGELMEMMTTHPYPSPTVGANVEPYNRFRATMVPTAQSQFYTGISGKPTMIQESGTFSQVIGNRRMSADWVRINTLSGLANGLTGLMWWCAFEHTHLNIPPYRNIMMERELGIVYRDKSPKPVGLEIQKMSAWLDSLPFDEMPPKTNDAVCILTKGMIGQNGLSAQPVYMSSCILGKQAGIEMVARRCNYDVPEAPLYIFPSISGWDVSDRETWDQVLEEVHDKGAVLLVTSRDGHLIHFSETFGVESNGFLRSNKPHVGKFSFGELNYTSDNEILLQSIGAEVLAENEEGNPIFTKQPYGKGFIYYLGFPMENMLWEATDLYNDYEKNPYYKIYQIVAKEILDKKMIRSENPAIGVTQHPIDATHAYAMAINYTDKVQPTKLLLQNGWKIEEVISGNAEELEHCDGVLLKLVRE